MATTVSIIHDVTNETVADATQDGDIMDTEIQSVSPNTNRGTNTSIIMGKLNCAGKSCDIVYGLHFYDMAQVVPKDAIITAAELWLYVEGYAIDLGVDGIAEFWAARIRRQDWVESQATWNNYNTGNTWTTAGADDFNDDVEWGDAPDFLLRPELTGLNPGDFGTANVAITTTTGPPGTLTDTRRTTPSATAWTPGEWIGFTVQCNSQTMVITGNDDDTLTGSGGWSGDPGDGSAYIIVDLGWWNPSILAIVQDAQENQAGLVHFKTFRYDGVTPINTTGWIQYSSKEKSAGDQQPHLRVTYEMGVPTDSTANINEGGDFAAADTTLTVTSSAPFAVGDFIRLANKDDDGYELLQVTTITDGTTIEVTRGEGGTSDVDHADSIDIFLWEFATFQANVY